MVGCAAADKLRLVVTVSATQEQSLHRLTFFGERILAIALNFYFSSPVQEIDIEKGKR